MQSTTVPSQPHGQLRAYLRFCQGRLGVIAVEPNGVRPVGVNSDNARAHPQFDWETNEKGVEGEGRAPGT